MTNIRKLVCTFITYMLDALQIIAFTHKNSSIENIGLLHLSEESQREILPSVKTNFFFDELMFLSTCNRVEIIIKNSETIGKEKLHSLIAFIKPNLEMNKIEEIGDSAIIYKSTDSVQHLFQVASSLDSLVIGEREIITQVRKAYELCNELNLTGDLIRLLIKQTIETAKEIYTNTDISKNPVSVVSLAYRQLRQLNIKNDARILIVGAGETNSNLTNYLKKHKFANFVVFNRTVSKAQKLANELNGISYPLTELKNYNKGFDVLITCTSSQESIITKAIYEQLLCGEKGKKVIIDLAVPNDIDREILSAFDVKLIAVETLNEQAKQNLLKRKKELHACEKFINSRLEEFLKITRERSIELAFGEIPKKVKEIKELALNEVFAKDINLLDSQSKEVLEKVLSYMEKKYNAVAMKTAKEALLKEN